MCVWLSVGLFYDYGDECLCAFVFHQVLRLFGCSAIKVVCIFLVCACMSIVLSVCVCVFEYMQLFVCVWKRVCITVSLVGVECLKQQYLT